MESKPHSKEDVRVALRNLESDLGNLDPAVHGEDLAAASGYAKDDLATVREYVRDLEEQYEGMKKYADEGWAWLGDALEALGAKTVFDIKSRKEQLEATRDALNVALIELEFATSVHGNLGRRDRTIAHGRRLLSNPASGSES